MRPAFGAHLARVQCVKSAHSTSISRRSCIVESSFFLVVRILDWFLIRLKCLNQFQNKPVCRFEKFEEMSSIWIVALMPHSALHSDVPIKHHSGASCSLQWQDCREAACTHGTQSRPDGKHVAEQQTGHMPTQHRSSATGEMLRQKFRGFLWCRSHEIPALLARSKEVETRTLHTQKQGADSLPSLLHCLASLYKLYPDLWLDENIK